MHRMIKTICIIVVVCLLFATSGASAAQYIYYDSGLRSPIVVVNVIDAMGVFGIAQTKWHNTNTCVQIVQGTGNDVSTIVAENLASSWYGCYTPLSREHLFFWGRAYKCKITLNTQLLANKSATFRASVLVHEFGHAFCLDDNPSSGNLSIMNYDRDRNYLSWPTTDDIAGVNYAYGE